MYHGDFSIQLPQEETRWFGGNKDVSRQNTPSLPYHSIPISFSSGMSPIILAVGDATFSSLIIDGDATSLSTINQEFIDGRQVVAGGVVVGGLARSLAADGSLNELHFNLYPSKECTILKPGVVTVTVYTSTPGTRLFSRSNLSANVQIDKGELLPFYSSVLMRENTPSLIVEHGTQFLIHISNNAICKGTFVANVNGSVSFHK